MARIANVNIPSEKCIWIALTYIYGIGRSTSVKICASAGVEATKRTKQLTDDELVALRDAIVQGGYLVEGDLRRVVQLNVKKKMDIHCYQGLRHIKRLPVRGQNTHSNARTRKGKAVAIAGKKKVTK